MICKKGKPCGNVCIPKNSTCHIKTGTNQKTKCKKGKPCGNRCIDKKHKCKKYTPKCTTKPRNTKRCSTDVCRPYKPNPTYSTYQIATTRGRVARPRAVHPPTTTTVCGAITPRSRSKTPPCGDRSCNLRHLPGFMTRLQKKYCAAASKERAAATEAASAAAEIAEYEKVSAYV